MTSFVLKWSKLQIHKIPLSHKIYRHFRLSTSSFLEYRFMQGSEALWASTKVNELTAIPSNRQRKENNTGYNFTLTINAIINVGWNSIPSIYLRNIRAPFSSPTTNHSIFVFPTLVHFHVTSTFGLSKAVLAFLSYIRIFLSEIPGRPSLPATCQFTSTF